MAITTMDGIITGMKPPEDVFKAGGGTTVAARLHSFLYTAGRPAAAVAPSPGIAGAALTTYAGQIPWSNPSSGNSYLARLEVDVSSPGTLLLCDRLWHNSAINVTLNTLQTINSVAWPARDRLGATNGDNILIAVRLINRLLPLLEFF